MKIIRAIGKGSAFLPGIVIAFCMFLVSFQSAQQQSNELLKGWDRDLLRQANSASDVTYLTDEEKKLILYCNLCRMKPKQFCQTILADYLKQHPDQANAASGLRVQLMVAKSIAPLSPDKELCSIAHDFAKKMGAEGKEGHADFQKRIKSVMSRYNRVGENCDYGNKLAIDACMNLLIDSSDPVNLGHRKNILDINFKAVGVSCQPHKTYHWNYVMDFGG